MQATLKSCTGEETLPVSTLARNLNYCGPLIQSKEVWHWDIAPIEDETGTIHLFLGEWAEDFSNWYKNARLAHYTAPHPEGPYTFVGYAITPEDLPGGYTSIYNARIKKIDGVYVMVYSASKYHGDFDETITTQATCMAFAHSLNGPWRFYGQDGTLAVRSNDPANFTYQSCCGCVNACIEKIGDTYTVFFRAGKSRGHEIKYGCLTSRDLFSGYVMQNEPLTDNINYIEDADCITLNGKTYLLTTDNFGGNVLGFKGDANGRRERSYGILWEMRDGKFSLANAQIGFGLLSDYIDDMAHAVCPDYGAFDKMERPAFLLQNGVPTYLYACSYTNVQGTDKSQISLFRIDAI